MKIQSRAHNKIHQMGAASVHWQVFKVPLDVIVSNRRPAVAGERFFKGSALPAPGPEGLFEPCMRERGKAGGTHCIRNMGHDAGLPCTPESNHVFFVSLVVTQKWSI